MLNTLRALTVSTLLAISFFACDDLCANRSAVKQEGAETQAQTLAANAKAETCLANPLAQHAQLAINFAAPAASFNPVR